MDEYLEIVARLQIVFARVPGLPVVDDTGLVVNILDYEPAQLQYLPTLYTMDRGGQILEEGNVVATHYLQLHRLCIKWQENEAVEAEIRPWINPVIRTLEADPTLQGYIQRGSSRITQWTSEIVGIGGTIYRALDFTSDTLIKRARVPRFI